MNRLLAAVSVTLLTAGAASAQSLYGGKPGPYVVAHVAGSPSWFETAPSLALGYRFSPRSDAALRFGRVGLHAPPEGQPGAVQPGRTTLELLLGRTQRRESRAGGQRLLLAANATVTDHSRIAYGYPTGYHFRAGPALSAVGLRTDAFVFRSVTGSAKVRLYPGVGGFAELRRELPRSTYYGGTDREVRTPARNDFAGECC